MLYDKLLAKEEKLAVIGLGYVGLPIALAFAKKVSVIGFDINANRIEMMKNRIDPSNEMEEKEFENCDIEFTASADDLKKARFFIIAVPTPIDEYNLPDLKPLLNSTKTVAGALKEGDYVVYESTVYPGCTEEECVPILEELSGLRFKEQFKVGFSPERINPGDKKHTLSKIVKVASGCDDEALKTIADIYRLVIEAGVHEAATIKVAEAAKIIENTQRDINIAFMNELSIIFNRLQINTYEVLEAAKTKWNFLNFFPGLVGGHCIGVDPYYLSYKAKQLGYHAQIINAGRFINDSMGAYVGKQAVKRLIAMDKNIKMAQVLVMGTTFKENVSDIRNSKVIDVINELKSYGITVDVSDPYASSEEMKLEYGVELTDKPGNTYDAVIITVNHKDYLELDEEYFKSICTKKALIVDVKGIYKEKIKSLDYWSL